MRKVVSILYYIIQYSIIGLSFLAFASTMEIIPWYEPSTIGTFFILMIIAPIQVLLAFIVFLLKEKLLINKRSVIVSITNSVILVGIGIISVLKEPLFYPLSVILSIVEVLLALYLFITIMKRRY
ncbi:hypothetical protein R0131_00495 [Clostridium sp. AL.422]|uniref:hypothetical protein n=1 Tax=Clostridium TaxID=1485 RepID=UPI00293DACFA|nr:MULTISPECIES: hypothetical protein [unclassified Clostridium]MDV4149307.1 hypothetical protein [Clostridium sp. AL.422]